MTIFIKKSQKFLWIWKRNFSRILKIDHTCYVRLFKLLEKFSVNFFQCHFQLKNWNVEIPANFAKILSRTYQKITHPPKNQTFFITHTHLTLFCPIPEKYLFELTDFITFFPPPFPVWRTSRGRWCPMDSLIHAEMEKIKGRKESWWFYVIKSSR